MPALIVGIGEILWDLYPDGRKVAGGAPFNFTYHCHNLGHTAIMVSRVGDDELGRELRDRVRALGLSDAYLQTDPAHPTGTVRVTVDSGGQPSYEIVEDVAWDHLDMTAELQELYTKCDAICFGTLGQRHPVSGTTIPIFVGKPATDKTPYRIFDVNLRQHFYSAGMIKWSSFWANTVKVNAGELSTLATDLNWPGNTEPEWISQLFALMATNLPKQVIVTDGEHGSRVYQEQGTTHIEPGVSAKVVDTVGAGDSFTAAMVCLRLEGKSLAECVRFATAYAARVCESAGGTPAISRAEVERSLTM